MASCQRNAEGSDDISLHNRFYFCRPRKKPGQFLVADFRDFPRIGRVKTPSSARPLGFPGCGRSFHKPTGFKAGDHVSWKEPARVHDLDWSKRPMEQLLGSIP